MGYLWQTVFRAPAYQDASRRSIFPKWSEKWSRPCPYARSDTITHRVLNRSFLIKQRLSQTSIGDRLSEFGALYISQKQVLYMVWSFLFEDRTKEASYGGLQKPTPNYNHSISINGRISIEGHLCYVIYMNESYAGDPQRRCTSLSTS